MGYHTGERDPGPDDIVFAIPGPGPFEIFVDGNHDLPPITDDETRICGYTQEGAADGPIPTRTIMLQVNGNAQGETGISIGADGCTVEGLSILGFANTGISINGTGNTVRSNYVGTAVDGETVSGTKPSDAIHIGTSCDDADNTIGGGGENDGNLIAGYLYEGVCIRSNGNSVEGNFIGTDRTGTLDLDGGDDSGVWIDGSGASSSGNTIGGDNTDTAHPGNVICGNRSAGVTISGSGSGGTVVAGNIIGLNPDETAAVPNASGVKINTGAGGCTIGGDTDGEGNVISGNGSYGVDISGDGVDNRVMGNYIGTDAAGTGDFGNGSGGVATGCDNTTVGGTEAARNYIHNNGGSGVDIGHSSGCEVSHNTIEGNGGLPYMASWSPLTLGGHDYVDPLFDMEGTGCFFLGDPGADEFAWVTGGQAPITFTDGTSNFNICLIHLYSGDTHFYSTFYLRDDIWHDTQDFVDMLQGMVPEGVTVENDYTNEDPTGFIEHGAGNTYEWKEAGTPDVATGEYISPPTLEPGSTYILCGVNLESATGNTIADNTIDDNAGNGVGLTASTGNEIAGNLVRGNAGTGVVLWDEESCTNRISRNSIYGNGMLGISLGSGVPTPNDGNNNNPDKPNRGYNFPVFSEEQLLVDSSGDTPVSGTAPPNSTVEFYNTGEARTRRDTGRVTSTWRRRRQTCPATSARPSPAYRREIASPLSRYPPGVTYRGRATPVSSRPTSRWSTLLPTWRG